MFKLKPIESDVCKEYLHKVLPCLVKRIKSGVTVRGKRYELSNEAKDILLPLHNTDHPDKTILEMLLIGSPNQIFDLSESLIGRLDNSHPSHKYPRKDLEHIFHYDYVINSNANKSDAYWLAKKIGSNTCTYCNRQYVFTVSKSDLDENGKFVKTEGLARPEFDHWFDKSYYPLMSLSIHNLIPSCKICNSSAKKGKHMSLTNHVHPYIDDRDSEKFKFVPSITKTEHPVWTVAIEREPGSKIDNTIKVFALDEVYGMHAPLEVTDIMTFNESYPKGYLKDILKNLTLDSKASISKKDAYRILFGSEFDEEKFLDRPLSKLKHDLLSHIGIIDEISVRD